ncbi:MAG TPA: MFS transporter [Reyranella sp.]|nr:MFS transporter [Reyranella sp.]
MKKTIAASDMGAGADNVRIQRGAIIAAALGNSFEWYDFTVYALFSIYLAEAFFPGGGSTLELVKALLAFGLGFVARPLGALVLGLYGDRAGRKAVLTAALSIMFAGTAILALAPTYAAIGVGAPLLILVGRTLQGFSAGGEFGGAAAFLSEHGPPARRGQTAAWLQASMGLSNIMGAAVAFVTAALFTHAQITRFAWRIPFLFGLLIALAGLWMRRTLQDSPEFSRATADMAGRRRPLGDLAVLFGRHWPGLARAAGLSTLLTVASYVLVIFMPVYVQRTFHFSARQAFAAALIGNVLLAGACLGSGALSDRFGRRVVLLSATVALGVCGYPLLWLLQASPTLPTLVLVQSLFCVATGAFAGPAPAALAECFPPQSRSVGVSLSYNLAVTIFSGFAPAALTWIAANGGGALTPAWYLTFAAMLAALAVQAG